MKTALFVRIAGFRLGNNWGTVVAKQHHFARIGVLRPMQVLESKQQGLRRFLLLNRCTS